MRTLVILLLLVVLAIAGCAVVPAGPYDAYYGPYYDYPYPYYYGYYGPYPYYGHWHYGHDFDRGRWHAHR